MISLSYIAAYDPYHTIFRLFVLLDSAPVLPVDSVRMLDFYLCFPWLLSDFRPAREVKGQVKAVNSVRKTYKATAYQLTPAAPVLFQRMKPSQLAALNSLAANAYIELATFKNGEVERTEKPLPEKIRTLVRHKQSEDEALLSLLLSLARIPLTGKDGLKARSGLQEHRYDNV